MQVLITISGFCGFCSRIGNAPCTTPFDFLFVISIHVPAWGTTMVTVPVVLLSLFQSTFPRGERQPSASSRDFATNFNPRSRVGNDVMVRHKVFVFDNFNPRSRVGNDGMTWTARGRQLFQSTFPRGERLGISLIICGDLRFQSTFPRGERPVCYEPPGEDQNFNPRSRVGNDFDSM